MMGAAVGFLVGALAAWGQIPPLNIYKVGHWDGHPIDYNASELWGEDRGYAYVGNRLGATMDILDISNPSNPTLVTIYSVPPPNQFCNTKDVMTHEGLMYVGMDDDRNDFVQIVDVRDPRNPKFLANVRAGEIIDLHTLYYDSGYLYMADGRRPVWCIVDLTQFDPDNPPPSPITAFKWFITPVGGSLVHDMTVVDGRAYVCAWNSGVYVYDVSDIANQPPVFLGSAPGQSTHSAWPTKDKRWVVTNEERTNGGPVKLYEVTENPFSITLRDTFSIPLGDASTSHNVAVVGYRAYCAWYNRGLMAFDINPTTKKLELVGHYDTSVSSEHFHGAWGVYPFLGRDKVLVSDKESQFWIFNVRIPASGDTSGDADVDIEDIAAFQNCFSGSAPYGDPECDVFDMDQDLDVDLNDHAAVVARMTGPR